METIKTKKVSKVLHLFNVSLFSIKKGLKFTHMTIVQPQIGLELRNYVFKP